MVELTGSNHIFPHAQMILAKFLAIVGEAVLVGLETSNCIQKNITYFYNVVVSMQLFII
jgi:hypothetical protein